MLSFGFVLWICTSQTGHLFEFGLAMLSKCLMRHVLQTRKEIKIMLNYGRSWIMVDDGMIKVGSV
jgi:hypothetical protein